MFETAEELRAHWDEDKERLEEEVEHLGEVLRYLGVAYDYLEEVLADRDSGDMLPSSSSRDLDDLFNRQMQISDRMAYREEERDRAQDKLDRWEEDLEWELEAHGFDQGGSAV
ncbi:hypothetical protein ACIP1U_11155 [Cupriavidus sp. NPDC089707]|uniref:hypothetical protein n=1 Tax=Cupriavidus sp. NPDC089707 TaxID=3363963 RepID=UPI0038055FD7